VAAEILRYAQNDRLTDFAVLLQSMSKPLQERIPAKYNATSELTVEVKTGGENVFDFALNGQPGK
jgi:hypothetical protein